MSGEFGVQGGGKRALNAIGCGRGDLAYGLIERGFKRCCGWGKPRAGPLPFDLRGAGFDDGWVLGDLYCAC